MPFQVSFRALEPSRLLRLASAPFASILYVQPPVRDTLSTSLLTRIG
jgi:hypothetical protein